MRAVREAAALLAVAAAGGGALWVVSFGLEYRARWDLCVVAGVAAALCWRLTRLVRPPPDPVVPRPDSGPGGDGLLLLTGLESRLSWGATDADRFRERVRPLLVELAEDRLRTRRGVDPDADPDRARQILGEPLWTLRTAPPARSPSRAELTALVAALERI